MKKRNMKVMPVRSHSNEREFRDFEKISIMLSDRVERSHSLDLVIKTKKAVLKILPYNDQ